ncbi:hypothetical protein [Chelativorans sp. AA-79]|uniref:DUF6931 family protein n=1 Tax=Chelativorans sp. AA-79 TaxID=3028735 RepID=UPI0023F73649|nr:hypothetical protein [Chelativorans sp. AA-79]WEX10879.1 hypothetical protein PVE73_08075 [Chelativorans sp. AA-79]
MQNRLRFRTAKELFNAYATAGEDMRSAPSDLPSIEFCRALLDGKIPEEAVTFCAYLLPRRVAVWWGHQCLTHIGNILDEQDLQMLTLAEEWIREPEEERRYAALDAGMAAGVKTPGVWIALAAGWSGGSVAPRGLAPVTPPPHLTARAINTGILAALARVPLARRASVLRQFVDMGLGLAQA